MAPPSRGARPTRRRGALGTRAILFFFVRFLLLAGVFGLVWHYLILPPYRHVLVAEARLVTPPDVSAEFVPEKDGLVFIRRYGLQADEAVASARIGTLTFNIIPFLALLFATPRVPLKRRLLFLPVGLLILNLTHWLHLYLDLFKFLHTKVDLDQSRPWASFARFYGMRLMHFGQAFMEQAGSMIMPFFLWLIFCGSTAREMLGVGLARRPAPDA